MAGKKAGFASKRFEKQFHYGKSDLGAVLTREGTEFRLWAPTAERVELRLYRSGHEGGAFRTESLRREEKGVWVWICAEQLTGIYYDYLVTVDGESRETADPYARACGLNGRRSMVIDLAAAAPEGWQEDAAPPRQAEDVIYELHVREFSWAESGGFPASVRGTYAAFCCDGTSLPGHPEQPTGLAYLRELGVTHVQLMPVYDFGSVDEADPDASFNWGYDPVNYNVPEGAYSSDPTRGEVRVRELRELVQSLHRQGFRVVMDVVYNHTYSRDSWLERTVPGYYYRTRRDGSDSNGSGCGNDTASERSMCAQYILDSVLFWAEEYHMDGFRFDLMGLLDAELIQRIRTALDERFGRGEKLVYGEPWAAASTACRRGTRLADKAALSSLDPEIGAFCDAVRDAVKGSVSRRKSPGFVNGGRNFEERILQSVTAWCGDTGAFHAAAPSQVITYLSCHDDMTLWDKLVATLDPNLDWEHGTEKVLRANRLAAAICMTCQGRLFFLSGEEFGRTKQGEDNTFRSPIELNRLDWQRAWENRELVEYYKGLIALRKQIPALCDKSTRARERVLHTSIPAPRCAVVELDNPEGPWKRILLIDNASSRAVSVSLPDGRWELLADGEQSFWWRAPHPVQEAKAAPGSALILGLA